MASSLFLSVLIIFFVFIVYSSSNKHNQRHRKDPEVESKAKSPEVDIIELSPYNQRLPDCRNPYTTLKKKTKAKAIICPMFRDEEGFLSEWLAYYQIMGFDHVMLFDDGSVDNYQVEIKPWVDSGFVTVKSNWSEDELNIKGVFLRDAFKKAMTVKALLESECKHQAIKWGYEYMVSLDLDEYVVPKKENETFVDELELWSNTTGRSVYCMPKYNFQSSPHGLEPIHLLTIEAYQSRMRESARMNFYTSVAPKCAYRLKGGADTTNDSATFIADCCHFHGCQGHDFRRDSNFCHQKFKDEGWRVNGKGKPWINSLDIFHYSRSLEKYALKQKTWKTSTGEVKAGETSEQAAKSYDIAKFLQRSVGWAHLNAIINAIIIIIFITVTFIQVGLTIKLLCGTLVR
jgi:hypothetical protein